MTNKTDYYANYGGQSVHDYVEQHIRGSAEEMARMRRTAALVPSGLSSSTKIASQAMPASVASSRATMGATLAASL